jgi:crossover junction endodeoxyribonuclease RuvC
MPPTEREVWDLLRWACTAGEAPSVVLLEKVAAMPREGVSSVFTFGTGYGGLRMALTALEVRWDLILPSKWQRVFSLTKRKGESKTAKKNRHKEVAARLFPEVRVTHAVADALLIAEYAKREYAPCPA